MVGGIKRHSLAAVPIHLYQNPRRAVVGPPAGGGRGGIPLEREDQGTSEGIGPNQLGPGY